MGVPRARLDRPRGYAGGNRFTCPPVTAIRCCAGALNADIGRITFALDLAGPIDGVTCFSAESGYGLTIKYIDYARPSHTVTSVDPGMDNTLAQACKFGAIGFKILEECPPSRLRQRAGRCKSTGMGAYVVCHLGTISTPQNVDGRRESCEAADGDLLHRAHRVRLWGETKAKTARVADCLPAALHAASIAPVRKPKPVPTPEPAPSRPKLRPYLEGG